MFSSTTTLITSTIKKSRSQKNRGNCRRRTKPAPSGSLGSDLRTAANDLRESRPPELILDPCGLGMHTLTNRFALNVTSSLYCRALNATSNAFQMAAITDSKRYDHIYGISQKNWSLFDMLRLCNGMTLRAL